MQEKYDALVIGTGFGGAVAAARLAQAKFKVGILERGRRYGRNLFPRNFDNPASGWLWRENQGLFDVRLLGQMSIVQGAGLGGGSLVYANVHARPPEDAFTSGWPAGYSRSALDPYYDLVAHMLAITPISPTQPKGLPPKSAYLDAAAKKMGRQNQYRYLNLAVDFSDPNTAHTNPYGMVQTGCNHCGECDIGCNTQSKNTLDLNYLALAEKHCGAEVATQCEATKIEPNGQGYRVHFINHALGQSQWVDAARVFVCAGAINSTELLLHCRDTHHTLPNLSNALGTRYSGNGDFLSFAFNTQGDYAPWVGPTITVGTVYDRGAGADRQWFILEDGGYPKQIANLLQAVLNAHSVKAEGHIVGQELAQELRTLARQHVNAQPVAAAQRSAALLAMGRDLANGRMRLQGDTFVIEWNTPSNLALYTTQQRLSQDLATQLGLGGRLEMQPFWKLLHTPVSVHNLGGCVMADNPNAGVVNGQGEVHGYPNLFVLCGAALPAATGVNPSHTIAAVAERNIEAIIRRATQNPTWQAPERARAAPVREPLDSVQIPPGGTAEPNAPVVAVQFTETMDGHLAAGAVDYVEREKQGIALGQTCKFVLTLSVPDVDGFRVDAGHAGVANGRLFIPGLTAPEGAPVHNGMFNLFTVTESSTRRKMLYGLPFVGTDGEAYLLEGFKDIRDDGHFDVWKSTTALFTTIYAGPTRNAPVWQSGILHIHPLAFLKQLTTLRVSGAPNGLASLQALLAFGRMFVGSLWDVFVRSKLQPDKAAPPGNSTP